MISIIIPHYNHHQALQVALRSILNQSLSDYEVIIVDDGSDEPLDTFALQQIIPEVIVITLEQNAGAPTARNVGLAHAKGTFVIFWDADVIGRSNMLKKMYTTLKNNRDVAFVYSNFYFGKKLFTVPEFSTKKLQTNNYIHSTSLVRRSVAIDWDVSLKRFQDWDYWLTLAAAGYKGLHIDETLYTVLPGGTMSNWLPRIAYKKPWSMLPGIRKRVQSYNTAKQVLFEKHNLLSDS